VEELTPKKLFLAPFPVNIFSHLELTDISSYDMLRETANTPLKSTTISTG